MILSNKTVVIVGAGPAGLMTAEVFSLAGVKADVCDAIPSSVGRKFLMAGKSGMNTPTPNRSSASGLTGRCSRIEGADVARESLNSGRFTRFACGLLSCTAANRFGFFIC